MNSGRHVVLLVLDTVRKDAFDRHATRVRERADADVAQCRAASSCSVPSHASMVTGRLPHDHGIHPLAVDYSGLDPAETVLGTLPNHRTVGVSANTFASSAFGFDGLFDEFVETSPSCRFPAGLDTKEFLRGTDATGVGLVPAYLRAVGAADAPLWSLANGVVAGLDRALSRLPVPKPFDDGARPVARRVERELAGADRPTFVFANLMDAHWPMHHVRGYDRSLHDAGRSWSSLSFDRFDRLVYNRSGGPDRRDDNDQPDAGDAADPVTAHAEFVENYRGVYAASVDYLDRVVADLLDRLAALDRETTVVVTADHGENLGYPADRGLFSHEASLTEALLHVPLAVVNAPDPVAAAVADANDGDGYVSHLDLGPLLRGIATGESVALDRESVPAELPTTATHGDLSADERRYWQRSLRCVYRGDRKVVWHSLGAVTEYGLDRSRPSWQSAGRALGAVPEWCRDPFADDIDALAADVAADRGTPLDADAATRARLEELGYR